MVHLPQNQSTSAQGSVLFYNPKVDLNQGVVNFPKREPLGLGLPWEPCFGRLGLFVFGDGVGWGLADLLFADRGEFVVCMKKSRDLFCKTIPARDWNACFLQGNASEKPRESSLKHCVAVRRAIGQPIHERVFIDVCRVSGLPPEQKVKPFAGSTEKQVVVPKRSTGHRCP